MGKEFYLPQQIPVGGSATRDFMANARQKLDVVNNAQAVAEAVWRGLIPRLVEPEVRAADSGASELIDAHPDEFALRLTEFMGATRNPQVLADCVAASRHVMAREYYKALMAARKIVEYEERVLNVASGVRSGGDAG